MKVKYEVALVVEIEADVNIDGDPETGLDGEVGPEDIDPENPIHQILMNAVMNDVIGPALRREDGLHNDVIAHLHAVSQMLGRDHPGECTARLHHCVGLEEHLPPVKVL